MIALPRILVTGLLLALAAAAPRAQQRARALDLRQLPESALLSIARSARAALDPEQALAASRAMTLRAESPAEQQRARLELGRSWLAAGEARLALRYAEANLADASLFSERSHEESHALRVRSLLRIGESSRALVLAEKAIRQLGGSPGQELRSAHAAALYRNQRMRDAERAYRELLPRAPHDAEILIRLGSGLLPSGPAPVHTGLREAIQLLRAGKRRDAEKRLLGLIQKDPGHPIQLRLLGDLVLQAERQGSPLMRSGLATRLWEALEPQQRAQKSAAFVPVLRQLDPSRRAVVERACYYFEPWLGTLSLLGARHDILLEDERTTDAQERAFLRGKRTFDGRLWDDVRGMGGRIAATGVEALDESAELGFDTLLHEFAHQVHLHAFSRRQKRRVGELFRAAKKGGHCLDPYAASHETEYFAQGVEAFFSFAKVAGQPRTHGHTRFELMRVDPELHRFLEELFRRDPLRGPSRKQILSEAFEAALLTGRTEDAATILELQGRAGQRQRARLLDVKQRFRTL